MRTSRESRLRGYDINGSLIPMLNFTDRGFFLRHCDYWGILSMGLHFEIISSLTVVMVSVISGMGYFSLYIFRYDSARNVTLYWDVEI